MIKKLESEINTILEQSMEHCLFPEADWFLEKMARSMNPYHLNCEIPDLIVLGEDIPQELALACARRPWFIPGGSLTTAHWSDALVPRDADPVSRSSLGWLINDAFHPADKALVVMALSSDNRRKLAGLLRQSGIRVAAADMPPRFDTASSRAAWVSEMLRLTEEMTAHTRVRLTAGRLKTVLLEMKQRQSAVRVFKDTLWRAPGSLSPVLREIILESARHVSDPVEWTGHLRRLTGQIADWSKRYNRPDPRPRVLLAGSPVIFPNVKIPALLEDAGLFLTDRVDAAAFREDIPVETGGRTIRGILTQMAENRLPAELSGAWICNAGLRTAVHERLERLPVDGIVYHVLKGQIEYDFELPGIEELAEEYGLPVIRVETDYQQQDVEQLRIRLEAFSEMLRQRSTERQRMAR